jgi:hypothetical protein
MKKPPESSIAVIGATRDVGEFLPKLMKVFEECFSGFEKVYYFFVENNSADNTREVLQQLSAKHRNFYPLFLGDSIEQKSHKTERIAIARNYAISEVMKKFPSIDYFAIADLDAINLGLTKSAIESCWEHSNWNAMFANQPDGYYDIYALRHPIWSPNDFLKDYELLENDFGKKIALDLSMHSKRIKIKSNSPLIEVESAFGGLGIYSAAEIFNETYIGLDDHNNPICEHLSVNLGIKNKGGKLFINPAMTNTLGYNFFTRVKAIVYEKFIRK